MRPDWLKVRLPGPGQFRRVRETLTQFNLATVCQAARCPNLGRCWGEGTATIMILGQVCTRHCGFCAVRTGNPHPQLDPDEPLRVAEAAKALSLRYLVITSVDRDDLPDFGASGFAKTIRAIKKADPGIIVEALIPDFQGDDRALKMVVEAEPKVIGHNLETVHRLTPRVRDHRVSYQLSLQVLDKIKGIGADVITKSGLMLGLGETEKDIKEAILDIRRVGVDILTLGQYLQPTPNNLPVERYWTPQEFKELEQMAEAIGFPAVASAPLVRSSYKAQELWEKVLIH